MRLHNQLLERDQTIQQLEGRMAMLAASERQLHEQLESMRAEASFAAQTAAESARDNAGGGSHASEREAKNEPRLLLGNASGKASQGSESRPLLRLTGERAAFERGEPSRRDPAASWTPPVTHERLTVAAVPQLATLNERPRAVAPVAPVAVAPLPPAAAAVESAREPSPADELYLHALDLLRRREFPEALRELDAFVTSSPRDPRLVRAQFFRGEILCTQRDFARALQAFEQSLMRDPGGDKAPDTLLRIVRCQHQLGAHERARAALNKLRTQFPESEAARAAAQVMQEDT